MKVDRVRALGCVSRLAIRSLAVVLSAVLLLAVVATPARAQTFVVDASGGPGSHFTSIATAVSTVPDGSTLLVRPGAYGQFEIDQKSLAVLADPGATVSGSGSAVVVKALLPSQQVVVRGFGVLSNGYTISVQNSAGTVVIERCGPAWPTGAQVAVANSADVRIRDCMLRAGSSPLTVTGSSVRVSQTSMSTNWPYAAIQVLHGYLELADVVVAAGGGYPGGAPILAQNSDLRIVGSSTLSVVPSQYASSGTVIDGDATVRLDPSVVLDPVSGAALGAAISATVVPMPAVTASTQAIGGFAAAAMTGPVGSAGALFVGLAGPLLPVPGWLDAIAIQPGTEHVLAAGVMAPSLLAGYAVPATSGLLGVSVTWQGVTLSQNVELQLSNPVTYAHW